MVTTLILFAMAHLTAGGQPDQSTPEGTLQMVFDAAASGDYSKLSGLCHAQEGDGDTRRICAVQPGDASFEAAFKEGRINGPARIDLNGTGAEVDFYFGPGGKREETMRLFKVGDKWYLGSF